MADLFALLPGRYGIRVVSGRLVREQGVEQLIDLASLSRTHTLREFGDVSSKAR